MESLQDIMRSRHEPEDAEVVAIKRYIDEHFHASVQIAIRGEALVITARSAALANTLRLHVPKIQQAAQTKKRLIFLID